MKLSLLQKLEAIIAEFFIQRESRQVGHYEKSASSASLEW